MNRRSRVWTVGDFAEHAGMTHRAALRFLKQLDAKHGGRLLIPSIGVNRSYRLLPAQLAKLEPALFEPVEALEFRVDALEDSVDAMKLDQRRIVSQVGSNTRELQRLRCMRRAS